jgi:DNA uptake protein ComE-like DNA-binding protein
MLPRFRYYIRFMLGMTRQEIRGIGLLLFLICLGMSVHYLYRFFALRQELTEINPKRYEEVYEAAEEKRLKNYVRRTTYIYSGSDKIKTTYVKKVQDWQIDINQADSAAWVALPGIGPGFARRIMGFRERLGGFAVAEQLLEVYGIDTVWVRQHLKKFRLGSGVYRPLFVNRAIWNEFRHPYLPYAQAKVVLNYRKQHGVITDFESLMQIKLVDPAVWMRLKPYLNFEP